MFRLSADYHTHTTFSHGKGSISENAQAAMALGLSSLGIADHGPAHVSYGISDLPGYLKSIQTCKQACAGRLQLLAGIELNLISLKGQTDLPAEFASAFDFKILGYHKFIKPASLADAWHFYVRRVSKSAQIIRKTTDAYLRALADHSITILAHPGYAIGVDLAEIASACAAYGTLFEINQKHTDLSLKMLSLVAKQGPKFVLSSDAHQADHVGQAPDALAKALSIGLSEKEIVNLSCI